MLAWCADAYNPALTVLAIVVLVRSGSWSMAGRRLGAIVIALVPVYVGKFLLKPILGEAFGVGFSTHVGYAVALTAILCVFAQEPGRYVAIAATTLYAFVVVKLGYHAPGDVLLTLLVIAATSVATCWLASRHECTPP